MAKGSTFFQGGACSKLRGSGMSHDDGMEDANRPWIARERALVKNMESNLEQKCEDPHKQDGGKLDVHPPCMEDSLRGLMQWWCQDEVGARRYPATGLVLTQCVNGGTGNTGPFSWTWSIESTGNFQPLNQNAQGAFSNRDCS